MSRCLHRGRIAITEEGTADTLHVRDPDGTWLHESDVGQYTGAVRATCYDCGLQARFPTLRYAPLWLRRAHADAIDDGPAPRSSGGETP